MKKILIIDDSALMRRALSDIINQTNEYVAEYTASNGVEGLAILEEKSDISIVLCDIAMPRMSGIELLEVVKRKRMNVPFIIISSSDEVDDTIRALELGAIEFIKKPERIFNNSDKAFEAVLFSAINSAMYVKTRYDMENNSKTKKDLSLDKALECTPKTFEHKRRLVALVCSTGGPKALQSVIPQLPNNLAAPVLIVQHMPAGFTQILANRLNVLSDINVKEAEDKEEILSGNVYIAKGGTHLTADVQNKKDVICFCGDEPVVGLKPCGDIMYESLVNSSYEEIVCVVLTGMGADGTKGIRELSRKKAVYVIAQDESSSTVYGMPRSIKEVGLADTVCDIHDIANEIIKKVGVI